MSQNRKTVSSWKTRRLHKDMTLPSGMVVDIEVPNFPMLLKTGRIPNHLVSAAIDAQSASRVTPEMVQEQHEFYKLLVSITVKAPEVTVADVDELPYEDLEMIVEFATRLRDTDAVGHHLGGLETTQSFRDLRGL